MTLMNKPQSIDEFSVEPLVKEIKGYSLAKLWADLSAALTAALVTVPQAMAYSILAGLPLSCGLFAAIFSAIIASVTSSSSYMIVGPTNAIAMLLQIGTAEIMYTYFREVTGPERQAVILQILMQLTMLVGILQITVAALKLGRLTQFVSHSVVVGYLFGVALSLSIGQLPNFFGLTAPADANSLVGLLYYVFTHLSQLHIPTTLLGIASLAMLLMLNKYNRKIPAAVVMLFICGSIVQLLGLSNFVESSIITEWTGIEISSITLVGDAGDLNNLFPYLSLPSFNLNILNGMIPIAFAIALLGTLETALVAKSLATSSGERNSVNQEILGLGLANLFSAFIGAMPSSASPSRSSLLLLDGAKTRFAAIFTAIYTGIIVLALGSIVSRAPLPSLAAILMISSTNIVKLKEFLLCLKATRSDRLVLIATILSCLFLSLDVAFYIGIMISITLYLNKAAVPHLIECTFDASGRISSLRHQTTRENQQIRVINVHGELFFGAADLFSSALRSIAEDDTQTKVLILRLKNARDMDATTCLALQQLHDFLKSSGRQLILCGVPHPSWDTLCSSGTIDLLGRDNVFILDEVNTNKSLQEALIRANELIHTTTITTKNATVDKQPDKVPEKMLAADPIYERS